MEFLSYIQVQAVVRDGFCPMLYHLETVLVAMPSLEVSMETLEHLTGCFQRPGLEVAYVTSLHISLVSRRRQGFKGGWQV